MPYPSDNPRVKHDLLCPPRLPPPNSSIRDESSLCFETTAALFRKLNEPVTSGSLKKRCFVYSFANAPHDPLSQALGIIGFADLSLSAVRKLLPGGDDDDDDDVPECLHKCTIAVKRADGTHTRGMEPRHQVNSKGFAQLMQQLRNESMVAILGTDKYKRFGILKPHEIKSPSGEKYNEEDFYCSCFVGNVSEVKKYLTQGIGAPRQAQRDDDQPMYKPPDDDDGPTYKPPGDDDGPMYKPPDDDGPSYKPPEDNGGGGDGMWQPPGGDSNESSSFDWQPPGAESSNGDNAFSWQPPASDGADFGGENNFSWDPSGGNNGGSDGDADNKRKRDDEGDGDDEDEKDEGENFHANKGAAAADAFYSGLTRTLDTRWKSKIYHMRAFNGWVKATQIQELDPKTKTSGGRGPMRVLDLACGKGGDLGKWVLHNRGIKDYVGSDVARGSLKDAAIRARGMRNKLKNCTFTCADLGHDVPGRLRSSKQKHMQKLLTWSLLDETPHLSEEPEFKMIRGGGIKPDQMFDVVSIQFAIHYMMQTRQRARRFFHTVSQLLEVGGNLICTTIDARVVIGHLMNLGVDLHFDEDDESSQSKEPIVIKVGAGACRISFEPDVVKKIVRGTSDGSDLSEDLFGLEYTFTLVEGSDHGAGVGDAVNLPEWLIPIPVLTALAEEAGLTLDYAQNFHEFFSKRKDPNENHGAHSSLYSMKVLNRNGSISPDEWEISRLYCAIKFCKVREPNAELNDEEDTYKFEDDEDDDDIEIDPKIKMKLIPMAMMKAKSSAGNDAWGTLSPEEKNRLMDVEVRKLAKAQGLV